MTHLDNPSITMISLVTVGTVVFKEIEGQSYDRLGDMGTFEEYALS